MLQQSVCSLKVLLVSLVGSACILGYAISTAATTQSSATPANWRAPRTLHGHPDLQGNWTNATLTPFERPNSLGERLILSEAEAQAIEKGSATRLEEANAPSDVKLSADELPNFCGPNVSKVDCGYNLFWLDPGNQIMSIRGEKRSSIVVQPKNGRVPKLQSEAQARIAANLARFRDGTGAADGPEVRALGERCILSFGSSAGPPMLPSLYNNNYQIVQSNDTVLILVEMVHDARVIRLNAPHKPANIKQWMGDSVGHWEGESLVVETINFHPGQNFRGASENLKVIERFTRIAPGKILYQFTIDDDTTFTQPWSGEVAMNATQEALYEYACHEGNYALPGILAGVRQQEAAAVKKQSIEKK